MSISRFFSSRLALFFIAFVCGISCILEAGVSSYRYDRLLRDEGRAVVIGVYRDQLTDLRDRRQNLILENSRNDTSEQRREAITQEMNAINAEIADLMRLIENLSPSRNQNAGALIARGLAGYDNFDYLDGVKIDGTFDGIKQGLIIRTADSIGKVMGPRITGVFEDVLGGSFDFIFYSLMDIWHDAMEIFFHSGKEPFDPKMLKEWLELIKSPLEDLERMMKDGLKENLRGYNMAKRKFGLSFEGLLDEKEGAPSSSDAALQEISDADIDLIWLDLISGYADQFERLCDEIDARAGYYDDSSMEVFYATQIKKRLQSFKTLLLESNSLIDLDAKLHSNKSLILVVRKNIENLFGRLMNIVEPRTYKRVLGGETTSASLFDRKHKRGSSGYGVRSSDDDFPTAFSNGAGF